MLEQIKKKKLTEITPNAYSKNEVDAYVDELIHQISKFKKEAQPSRAENSEVLIKEFEKLQTELDEYKEIEASLKNALTAAHEATKKIQEVVEAESREILYNANKNADLIVSQALEQSIQALDYIKQMRTDARVFQERLKILVDEQDKLTEKTIWKEVLAPIEAYDLVDIRSIDDIDELSNIKK